ncbi:MAG: DUF371 domain-containing protein [Candidatus Nanoarchaeia archaeon]
MLQFTAWGHPNVTGNHRTTLEFTKADGIGIKADCIIGVRANFDCNKIKEFMKHSYDFVMHIVVGDESVSLTAQYNVKFDDDEEIVLRMGLHDSTRTLGLAASMGANSLSRIMIERLKDPQQEVLVQIEKTA